MKYLELSTILTNHFNIDIKNSEVDAESAYLKFLERKLAARIQFLINSDVEKLLQILYRIDVPQQYSDEAFDLGDISKISMKLSELIIKRQLKKIEYAKQFNQENS